MINVRGFVFDTKLDNPIDIKCITNFGEVQRKVNTLLEMA